MEQDGPKSQWHWPKQFGRDSPDAPPRSAIDENVVVRQKPSEEHSAIENKRQHAPQNNGGAGRAICFRELSDVFPAANPTKQKGDNDEPLLRRFRPEISPRTVARTGRNCEPQHSRGGGEHCCCSSPLDRKSTRLNSSH